MSIKFKTILMSVVIAVTAFMFAGCDTWSMDSTSGTLPPITTGTTSSDKTQDPNLDPNDAYVPDGDELVDESEIYNFLEGVKVAYDGTYYKMSLVYDARLPVVYSRISTEIKAQGSIDCAKFASQNSDLGVDATYISRAVWLYNYIEQYRTLAALILTSFATHFGFGSNNYIADYGLYGELHHPYAELKDDGDYTSDLNAINAGAVETGDIITIPNDFKGAGEAVYDDGSVNVDFDVINEIELKLSSAVPTRAYYFKMNTLDEYALNIQVDNPYYDPDNIVNQPEITNPAYDPSDPLSTPTLPNPEYIEGHILSMNKLNLVGTPDINGDVHYTLGAAAASVNPDAFIADYVARYADYLGLKLLQAHADDAGSFAGDYLEVTESDYLDLYHSWSVVHNALGFSDKFIDSDNNERDTVQVFADVVVQDVVGDLALELDAGTASFSRDLGNVIYQIVDAAVNARITHSENYNVIDDGGEKLFANVPNVEWRDYTAQELFGVKDEAQSQALVHKVNNDNRGDPPAVDDGSAYEEDIVFIDDQYIYSVVIMLKKDYEPVVMSSIMMLMLAPETSLELNMYFRFVDGGEEKIFDAIDYSVQVEPEEGDYAINNNFTGHLDRYNGEEITMEYADKSLFVLEGYNTPKINTILNQEIVLENFANALPSDYGQSLNVSFGGDRYAYKAEFDTYYYNDSLSTNDYIEINFHATTTDEGGVTVGDLRLALYALYFENLSAVVN